MPEPITAELSAIMREAEAGLARLVPPEDVEAEARRCTMSQRAERIEPYRRLVTDEDFRRIVRGELDTVAARTVAAFMRAPRSNPRSRVLWLAGGVGVGKTVAALSAIAEVGGRLVSADKVRRAYGQEHDEAKALRDHIELCRLLVVDDVGTARDSEGERRGLYECLNGRQGGWRKTILTGNLSAAEVRERFDERLVSRVRHIGAIVDCGAASLRWGAVPRDQGAGL